MTTKQFSPEAQNALAQIGKGFRLRIPHDGTAPTLVYGYPKDPTRKPAPVDVSAAVASELLGSGVMYKLTRDGVGQRGGWFANGLDGARADFYCLVI